MPPFFSVVVPIYNRKNFFKICVDSVLNQTFKDFELIVVDDGSTDSTITLMSEYVNRGIIYIFDKHFGVSHARNKGIGFSRGEYIAFLDSDDRWGENKLEMNFEYIKKFPEIKIFHTDEVWFKEGKILKQKGKHKKPTGYAYSNCLPLCCIGMSTAVVKKDLFDEIGLFDEDLPACEDYDLWLRACSRYEVKLIPEPLTIKDGGREDQLSNQPSLDKYRVCALEKMLKSGVLNDKKRELTYKELVKKCSVYAKGAEKRGRRKEAQEYLKKIKQYKI